MAVRRGVLSDIILFAERVAEVADEGGLSSRTTARPSPGPTSPLRPDLRTGTSRTIADPGSRLRRPPPNSSMAWRLRGVRLPHARWEAEFVPATAIPPGGCLEPRTRRPLGPDRGQHAGRGGDRRVSRAGVELNGPRRPPADAARRPVESRRTSCGGSGLRRAARDAPAVHDQSSTLVLATVARRVASTAYRQAIEQAAAEINEHWGHPVQPVVLDVADNRNRSVAAMARYDVWSAPLRDGEPVARKRPRQHP